ncbi:aldehyde ferredoxin oxidoreductase [Alkaliphilus transvaalensis]|uniref:aldehyde ferredoxin oxidoreductase n=1 Tax=Alkaliphilus transvaalensis TaxID=114628 RepID=UPI00047EA08B|nr:aldehyde ferredoxin oxidoreductase [Alkaliphilus transvaalensis]
MSKAYGWAGSILRVNLTTGVISAEETSKYKNYIGGMGFGYRIMWDEVPVGTKPFDAENKVIFGAGPLTGTGMPCSGRTNITSLLPSNPYHLITDSHMGGHFSPAMKYAGWDAIIIEGASDKPVWLKIENDNVSIEDASGLWGKGTFDTTAEVTKMMGDNTHVACIGQAGENMVNLATIMTGKSHSAGGHGGILGSKKLKAIGIRGTKPVNIAGDRSEWIELDKYMMSLIGANNQHVVPNSPQPWAEYHNPGSRWTGKEGLYWGGANPPVETGVCDPHDMNSVGLRTQKGVFDHGPLAEDLTVRMGGCQACPVRCHSQLKVSKLKDYGFSEYIANTCMGYFSPGGIMIKGWSDGEGRGEVALLGRTLGASLADDYGVWCNYGQIGRDFKYAYEKGILEKVLPKDEYDSIPWDKLEAGDPEFLVDFYRRIAFKEGELSHLGEGASWVSKRWNFGEDFYTDNAYKIWSPQMGFPVHHSNEAASQVGALISCMFNRDAQCHTHINFTGSGLPIELQREIAGEVWGSPDALDIPKNYTPMNEYKAKFAKWSIVRNVLHDSLTLCNWMWPMTLSPLKERGYRGDTSLESKFLTLATGINFTEAELDLAGERIFTLHRAMTVKQMGTIDMRNQHDRIADWVFDDDPDVKPFTEGTDKLDREDMELALTMFYKEMGWDEKTGAPTKETLVRLGLSDVADQLAELKLLP